MSVQDLHARFDISLGGVRVVEVFAAVQAVGSRQVAGDPAVVDDLRVHDRAARHVEAQPGLSQFAREHREIEPLDIESGQIGISDERQHVGRDVGERGGAGHVGVGNPMHARGLRRDRHPRVHATGHRLSESDRMHLDQRYLDDAVRRRIDAGRFQIHEDQGTAQDKMLHRELKVRAGSAHVL